MEELRAKIANSTSPDGMRTKIIAIDGPGGAGKSTLSESLARELGAVIIHTDDFASWDNPLNWWPRMIEQVLEPLHKNQTAKYQRYDWGQKRLAEWHEVQPRDYLIIEGVSSSRREFRPFLAFTIWVDTPRSERLRRGLERDGQEALEQWQKWMSEEDAYIKDQDPAGNADAVISGMRPLSNG